MHHIWCTYTEFEVKEVKQYWEILRELREDRDLKQWQLANVLNTTSQVYSRYELGINELPLHHLKTLCMFYEVSADYILGIPEGFAKERGETLQ